MAKNISITFHGGAGSVTGSNFLLEGEADGKDFQFLIDCGLMQGSKVCDEFNYQSFPYETSKIDALFVTHGHLDHVGRIGKLIKDGFTGPIYSTSPTRDIAELIMLDSLGVMEKEQLDTKIPPLYTEDDVAQAMAQWRTFNYHEPLKIGEIQVVFRDAGHILGSSMIEFTINDRKLLFTGDLGNSPAPLLQPTEKITDIDYLVTESVYGDRNHEQLEDRRLLLRQTIKDTIKAGGTLMIPAFSVERTQELLFEIENMMEDSEIPLVPVFLDSPLAIAVTKVYEKHKNLFNKEVRSIMNDGDGIFRFPQLQFTKTTDQSKAIINAASQKIVIAGSGMSNGGRILHHEKNYLPDKNSTLLLAGYQAHGSMGRFLEDGAKKVRILGHDVAVRAKIVKISGYSAHKDADDLVDFIADSADTLKKVFCVLGEPKSSMFLAQRVRDYLGLNAVVPEAGQTIKIDI
ncbi:MAG: metallo-beta-lactamase family protein [Patescibacteria group bacterium]|nr:metallo-beta-lactamase family protein [Patescibacteria group bacterium]